MHKKSQVLIALVVVLVAVASVSAPAFANTTKPGWDTANSSDVHIGPLGQSVRPTIVQRLEDRENKIVTKLSNNNKIPEPTKTNIINQIQDIFTKLISMFS